MELNAIQQRITKTILSSENQHGNPTATWNGADWNVTADTGVEGSRKGFGVNEVITRRSITFRLYDLTYASDGEEIYSARFEQQTDQPLETQRITMDGVEYEIMRIERPLHKASITLKCESPFKGSAITR
jgi:hypothetical protein